jgi:hypothetical protein
MSVNWEGRFTWGDLEIKLAVDGGVVRDAQVYSDSMDWALIALLGQALPGCRFSTRILADAALSCAGDRAVLQEIAEFIRAQEI